MGRIKQTFIKRAAEKLIEKHPSKFKTNFEHNKKMLYDVISSGELECESKSVRNKLAGYLVRATKPKSPQTYRPPVEDKRRLRGRRPREKRR